MEEIFHKIARKSADLVGSSWAFMLALASLIIWAATGPLFGFSDTWQLIINTATTVVTFLMVFLIQNTQNRDAKAMQLKLDELIRAIHGARNGLVDLEELSAADLQQLELEFRQVRERAAHRTQAGEGRVAPRPHKRV